MTFLQKVLSIVTFLVLIVLFYLAGHQHIPSSHQFVYQKTFLMICMIAVVIELFRSWLARNYEQQVKKYMDSILATDGIVLHEVQSDDPLHSFQERLVKVMERAETLAAPPEALSNFQATDLLRHLEDHDLQPFHRCQAFLSTLSKVLPSAEIYLFTLGNQKIYPLLKFGAGENPKFHGPGMPFSNLSEFSGKAASNFLPVITNDLKSDPNLGQFVSQESANVPIYGAVFPLGNPEKVKGLIWIRDANPAEEFFKRHSQEFDVLLKAFNRVLFSTPYLSNSATYMPSYPQFEMEANHQFELAKSQSMPFSLISLFVKTRNPSQLDPCTQSILSEIQTLLPAGSMLCREEQILFVSFFGKNRDDSLKIGAKLLDRGVRYLSLECGDQPVGDFNGAVNCYVPTDDDTLAQGLKSTHRILKDSLAEGPNQIRINENE